MKRWHFVFCFAALALAAACRPPLSPATSAATLPPEAPAATATSAIEATAPPESSASATPQAGAAASATPVQPTLAPGELVKFSGEDFGSSGPFHLGEQASVEIAWDYSGSGYFALWLVNDSEDLVDISLYRVLIADAQGQSQASAQYTLEAGDYYLEVEQAEGPWLVSVKSLE